MSGYLQRPDYSTQQPGFNTNDSHLIELSGIHNYVAENSPVESLRSSPVHISQNEFEPFNDTGEAKITGPSQSEQYGYTITWDDKIRDWITHDEVTGEKRRWTELHKKVSVANIASPLTLAGEGDRRPPTPASRSIPASGGAKLKYPTAGFSAVAPNLRAQPIPGKQRQRMFEKALHTKFSYVDKPKRFFSVGRIFKTVWFEPTGSDIFPAPPREKEPITVFGATSSPSSAVATTQTSHIVRHPDLEYTHACPQFYTRKPYAKFRWFIVVRKRLHHSLCFSITTFAGKGATRSSRGRAQDFVVLYAHNNGKPPLPEPEEKVSREPLGVIIEDDEQFISPIARLDCGRLYTVEDNLCVMKVGRVHPEHLGRLEEYYRKSVE